MTRTVDGSGPRLLLWGLMAAAVVVAVANSVAGPGATAPARRLAVGARGVVIPCYATDPAPPVLVGTVQVDEVGLDHRRLGFFKVRLRPFVVARGVRVELESTARLEVALAELGRSLSQLAGAMEVEVSDFAVCRRGDARGAPWIHARSARLVRAESRVRLDLNGVVLRHGTNEVAVPHAQLGLGTADARLCWRVGDQTVRLEPATMTFSTNRISDPRP